MIGVLRKGSGDLTWWKEGQSSKAPHPRGQDSISCAQFILQSILVAEAEDALREVEEAAAGFDFKLLPYGFDDALFEVGHASRWSDVGEDYQLSEDSLVGGALLIRTKSVGHRNHIVVVVDVNGDQLIEDAGNDLECPVQMDVFGEWRP